MAWWLEITSTVHEHALAPARATREFAGSVLPCVSQNMRRAPTAYESSKHTRCEFRSLLSQMPGPPVNSRFENP